MEAVRIIGFFVFSIYMIVVSTVCLLNLAISISLSIYTFILK